MFDVTLKEIVKLCEINNIDISEVNVSTVGYTNWEYDEQQKIDTLVHNKNLIIETPGKRFYIYTSDKDCGRDLEMVYLKENKPSFKTSFDSYLGMSEVGAKNAN